MVVDGTDLNPGLLADFARDRVLEALARLDKAGEGRIHAGREVPRAPHQRAVAVGHQHDHGGVGARKMHRVAGGVGAAPHVARFLAAGRGAAYSAKAVARVPVQHRAGMRQKPRLAAIEPAAQLPQIGKPHRRRLDAARRAGRRLQHLQWRLDGRQVEREMGALFDKAEKDDLAAREPLIGGADLAEQRADFTPAEHNRQRLAALALDDEVLVAPHRDKEACRVGGALDDPPRLAAAQPGALEPGRSIVIVRSHNPDSGMSRNRTASRARPRPTPQAGLRRFLRPGAGYGRAAGPRESGTLAAFSFQSFDQGVTGFGTALPSTRISSTCSL